MIIFFGPAGSGKSVQGQMLAEKNGWTWISMGQLLRDADDPELNSMMEAGVLVPPEVTNNLIDAKLKSLDESKVVVDGYPRQMEQADWLLGKHKEGIHKIDMAVVIEVPREESVRRLLLRGRKDDTTDAIEERLKIFLGQTIPIIYYVKKEGIPTVSIDGIGSIEEVHERILGEMKKCNLV